MSGGHTFNPPDGELINRYLNKKIRAETIGLGVEGEINEVNICHHEPADLPGLAKMESSHTWHILSRVEKLKGRCERTKRSSKTGHWKVTGKSCKVKDIDGNIIGFKKFLVFQENKRSASSSSSSVDTEQNKYNWIIHEYHSAIQHHNKDAFVLCKIMRKTRAPRSDAVANTSLATTDLPPIFTSNPIITHSQAPKENIFVQDYGGDYCDGLEDIFPGFENLLDQPQYYDYSLHFSDITTQELEVEEN